MLITTSFNPNTPTAVRPASSPVEVQFLNAPSRKGSASAGPFWVQPIQMFALAFTLAVVTAQIPVQMTSDVSSRTASVGDKFTFVTSSAVTADTTTIPKGTPGYGVVAAVSHAAGTHKGSLELRPQ